MEISVRYFCLLCLLAVAGPQVAARSSNITEPPDFYIIGVQKCGTTSVYGMIETHPELCKGTVKEPHYFDLKYDYGPKFWSERYYKDKNCKGHYVDGTPAYFTVPEIPIRMYQSFAPETRDRKRFVVILRDPVARMYSWYNHNMNYCAGKIANHFYKEMESQNKKMPKNGWDLRENTFPVESHCQNLQLGKNSPYLKPGSEMKALATFAQFADSPAAREATGFYSSNLAHWLTHFRRNQILILNFENVLQDPAATANAIAAFFNLSHGFPSNTTLPHANNALFKTVLDCATRDKLVKRYAEHVADLYDYMERTPAADKPPMEPPFGRFNHAAKCT